MLGSVLRSRVLARPGSHCPVTRFVSPSGLAVRTSLSSTPRTFVSCKVLQEGVGRPYPEGISPYSRWGNDSDKKPRRRDPSETLYVGNVPFYTVRSQMEEFFGEYGPIVSVRLAVFPSGESRGFAHVEYADVASAQRAMDAHDKNQFFMDGRTLRLDFAGAMVKPSYAPSATLHFGDFEGDELSLKEILVEFKDVIKDIRLIRNPQTNMSNRYAFVQCATQKDAATVLNKFNGKEIAYGQVLNISYARGRSEAPRFVSYGSRESRSGGDRSLPWSDGDESSRYDADDGEYRPRQDLGGGRGDMSYRVSGNGPNRGQAGGFHRGQKEKPYGMRQHNGDPGENNVQ